MYNKNKYLSLISSSLVILTCFFSASCKTNQQEKAENAKKAATSGTTTTTPTKTNGAKKDDPSGVGVYPGFDFGKLKVEHQKLFIEIAKTELCPCKDSKGSLHECLQSEDPAIRCATSMQSAQIIAIMANGGVDKTDIYDKLHAYIDSTKKTHTFDLKNTPLRGNKDAKIVLVEFADFQCPHCREAAEIMDEISEKMGDKVAFYYKNFPLGGEMSIPAASAALAAHKQNKFWPMHDLLFKNQRTLDEDKIEELAQKIGLNMKRFKTDLLNPEIVAQVNMDRKEGEKAGLSGTPTLYINGKLYMGEKSVDEITTAINEVLEGKQTK